MIHVQDAVTINPDFRFRKPVSLTIGEDEHVAFVGLNGGGKSILAQMLMGNYPLREGNITYGFSPSPVYNNIKFISFRDSYGSADSTYYLQQRWNSQDRDESPLVCDILESTCNGNWDDKIVELFDISRMLDRQVVLLSSGELRKFQLIKALLSRPCILIIDKPFIGLDVSARAQLYDLLRSFVEKKSVQVILLLAKADEIPDFITHIVPVNDMLCGEKVQSCDFCEASYSVPVINDLCPPAAFPVLNLSAMAVGDDNSGSCEVINMRNVSICYGERTILDSLNWVVKRGEKWALLGKNGSGKSTLLSLICADNPQSYACDISLFGCRRGSGESIWDIKRRIGYVSPEMHRAYSENLPAIAIVASGLHDSVGLYVQPRPEQMSICEWWMDMFGIREFENRSFLQLSDGEQRMVLLARAFVKDPELLVLDEPLHGLDSRNRLLVCAIISAFCSRPNKTLIMVTHYEAELPDCITSRLVLG